MVTKESRAWQNALQRRIVDERGCWISTYKIHSGGYAWVRFGSRSSDRSAVAVHRLAVAVLLGVSIETLNAWTDDAGQRLDVDHLCRVRSCFNPAHLELVDHRTNVLRGEGRAAQQARQTACVHGHRLEGANLMPAQLEIGKRKCLVCSRVRGIRNARRRSGRRVPSWAEVEAQALARGPEMARDALGAVA